MRLQIGVVRGGPSGEYPVSLKSGATVLKHLERDKYHVHDILLDRQGAWHLNGRPVTPEQLARHIDVVFNALHGTYGEDGQVQRLFDRFGIAYTGSGATGSAHAMHKLRAKETFVKCGILTPMCVVVPRTARDIDRAVYRAFRALPGPYMVKPVASGSSLGIARADSFSTLREAVEAALEHGQNVVVEECITGREATCGVVEGFRGEELYALPPVEIVPHSSRPFFDYEAKYSGSTEEICPARFSKEEKRRLMEYARRIHQALGLRHYSRSDFIVSPRGIFALEVNTLPGLTDESLLPKSVAAVGAPLSELFDHLIDLTYRRR